MADTEPAGAPPAPRAWPASKVFLRPIGDLIPYAANARRHPERQIEQIAASIRTMGWTVPILVDENGVILAGHGRLAAAKKLKLKKVPVMVAEGWSADEKRAYVLADNQLAVNAAWDDEMLSVELAALAKTPLDLTVLGFNDDEISERIAATPRVNLTELQEVTPSALLKWGKVRVDVTLEDAAELTDLYTAFLNKTGGAKGFATYLLTGNIGGGHEPKTTH